MEIRFRAACRLVRRQGLFWLLALCAASAASTAGAQGLSADAQQRVRAATFEVVQLKPDDGAVTYERALPMELIPYQQRVDKYVSIGTAFAIGHNRFVTAGHVISRGTGSQFGPPALRDAAGAVYAIDKVIKFAEHQDFVEFSLQHEPPKIKPLETGDVPPLNDPVYAVGNALGQGVVIRDGVYTSSTPEELEGRWSWLRFTAAASPGNSGGPLVDKKGKVIGVVLRKSESENLNYAVPIKLLSDASETQATVDARMNFRLPVMDASETINTHDQFPLPKSLADFYSALEAESAAIIARGDTLVIEHNKDRLFPLSSSSAQLLREVIPSPFPRYIEEGQDRRWVTVGPKNVQTEQLDHNGFVRHGGPGFELRAPDDVKLATLFSDSKVFMDLLLRSSYELRRQIGSDAVKVTSLGKAREEFVKADSYGRNWNFRIYAVPFDDAYVVTMNLPTPEGAVSLFIAGASGLKDILVHQQELLSNYVWVTYRGTLPRWREFLDLKAAQPQGFSRFTLNIDPAYQRVQFHSARYDLALTPEVIGLTADSVLSLNFSFIKDADAVVWDVAGVALGEGARHINFVDVRRFERPLPDMPQAVQVNWTKITTGDFPFNGVASDAEGGKTIRLTAPGASGAAPDAMKVRYVLTLHNEGSPAQEALHAKLEGLEKGFKAMEQ
ncbi:MAG TPA: trypsin-like peptidase domain-containing protein [Steroidobacteraceae bacterium]|nr:trypsin-like peptidase domain-containing protein [Steroidobacteraceae bacterium]